MSGPGCVYTTVFGAVCNEDAVHRLRKAPNGHWIYLCADHADTVESAMWRGQKIDREELT